MAKSSLATRKQGAREYQLPEVVRRHLVEASSECPTACIAPKRLAVVERQRLHFIAKNGSDNGDLLLKKTDYS